MVSDALRAVMLAAEGAGEIDGDDVCSGRAEHPICGDEVEVQLRLGGGRIVEIAWRASGCPACMAVAAAAPAALRDCPTDGIAAALERRLGELGGLASHERHAGRLFLAAVDRALTA